MVTFEHIRCPLNRYTFSVRPIRNWVLQHCQGLVLNLFAGPTMLEVNEVRNDIDPGMPAHFHMDALEFLQHWTGGPFDTILLDPPYAYRKSMELYNGFVSSPFRRLKDEAARHISEGGRVITFGYHSIVMGTSREFQLESVALFSHGGAIHDTIACVERYLPTPKLLTA